MYANIYGTDGVRRAIELLKKEIFLDAVNLGITDLKQLNASWVSDRTSELGFVSSLTSGLQLDLDYFRRNQWENFW